MKYVVFATLEDVESVRDQIDNALGYPKGGSVVNGGLQVDPGESLTEHHCEIKKHPSHDIWALSIDDECKSYAPEGMTEAELPEDWFPIVNMEEIV